LCQNRIFLGFGGFRGGRDVFLLGAGGDGFRGGRDVYRFLLGVGMGGGEYRSTGFLFRTGRTIFCRIETYILLNTYS